MAFIAFIRDITSSAGILFSPEEIEQSTHLTPADCSTSCTESINPTQTTKTSQINPLRQSGYGIPWGVNIPPYRRPHTESPSLSSSSSSPESSVSSALRAPSSQHFVVKSDFQIQSNQYPSVEPSKQHPTTSKLDNSYNSSQLNRCLQQNDPGHSHVNQPNSKVGSTATLDTIKNIKSRNCLTTTPSKPIDFISGYPKSVTPTSSITTESVLSIQLLGTEAPPSSFCSHHSVSSPQLLLAQSLPTGSFQGPNFLLANQSPTTSPRTAPSPATCETCRFPLHRTPSESSFLLKLSHRSPLFDDLDEDGASHSGDPSHPDTPSIEGLCRSNSTCSFSSSSPEAFHSLSSWWSDIPPHRRAHIIEADSWPIFTPSAPLVSNDSTPGEQCACPSPVTHVSSLELPDVGGTEQTQCPQDPPDTSSPPRPSNLHSRLSFSKNLNLLVPIPLDQDETDPLLSTTPSTREFAPVSPEVMNHSDSDHSDTICQAMKRKKRREESTPKSSESLLTKSLRRLSRKLPNIQWGNLSVRMQNNTLGSKGSATGEEEQEEESVLPSGVVDEDSLVELAYEDEKAQISRLVKSWTLDNIQPQNSLNGSFINDPEMEWSSMVVQLETFSPSSTKKSRSNLQIQPEKKVLRSSRAQQYSRKENGINMDSTTCRSNSRRRSLDERTEAPHEKKAQAKRNSRSMRNQQHPTSHENRKNAVKITKRVVSNPLHLLQLTLELEMMRKMKINSPLKQRSMKLILIKRSQPLNNNNGTEFDYVGSPLRSEIL